MKHKLLTLAGALAVLAVIGKYYATPLLPQARAALVKNIDEKGRIAYEADSSCFVTTPGVCTASFPPVPPGKNLVIEYISAGLIIVPSGPTPPEAIERTDTFGETTMKEQSDL